MTIVMTPLGRESVGGISGAKLDVIVREGSGWAVYSEGTPRKRLGGPYSTREQAQKRLAQIEWFKRRGDAVEKQRKKRKPLPRQIPPTRIEEAYAGALVKIIGRVVTAWQPVIRALPDLAAEAAAERGDARMDAHGKKLRALIDQATAAAQRAIQQPELEALARKFAARTGDYHKSQLAGQVRAAMGVDPVFKDRGMSARVDQFAHHNASLIKRIPERLHGDVQSMVTRAVSGGMRNVGKDSLAKEVEERFGVSERHARVIARDQIGKFYANVNHARQRELGVKRFTWRTVGDERVRGDPSGKYPKADPSHYDLDEQEYDYDDPPEAGPYGEPCLPGEAIQCRCYAEPILDDLLGDDEEDDEDEEE